MIGKLAEFLHKKAKNESQLISAGLRVPLSKIPENKKSSQRTEINLEYIDAKLQQLFKLRQDKTIESRIRFQIQDLIDEYEKAWKHEIAKARAHLPPDNDGFQNHTQKQYVPKDSIITREDGGRAQKGGPKPPRHRKSRLSTDGSQTRQSVSYVYMQKTTQPAAAAPAEKKGEEKAPVEKKTETPKQGSGPITSYNKMKILLSGLKPETGNDEDTHSEDEKADEYIGRKISIHQVNVVGTNFEKYNDLKPNHEIKLKILNFFMEYNESADK